VTLGQEGVHRDHATVQDPVLSERLDSRDRMSCVVHGVLGERHAHMVRQRREQMCPRRPVFFGPS
jgi:hypothetical protein